MGIIKPKGHIVHAMSEYISREGLFYTGGFLLDEKFPNDKLEGTFKGKKVKDYPEWIFCKDWLEIIGLSVHGYVLPNGDWLEGNKPAPEECWHAGKSKWGNLSGLNKHFLGFEVIVEGRNDYGTFIKKLRTENWVSDSALMTCVRKSKEWLKEYNYTSKMILRHSDVSGDDVRGVGKGKLDTGKMFPWDIFKGLLDA
jgi:N-acetyl-anhydromuramyl-L-alanine amidase AmpD